MLPGIAAFYKDRMYRQLKYKFRAWICLQQIDTNATVSFRGYDLIRNIEFAKEDHQKYCRGLLQSWHKLSKLCRQLESFGKDLLHFEVTENSVKFDIECAVKFILDKHGYGIL